MSHFKFYSALCMNSIGATQDIATDGLAVRILKEEQQHFGNMFQVIGSRLGFIVGGGAILWAMDWLSWQTAIFSCNTLPIWFYQEPEHLRIASKKTSHQTNIDRFEWFRDYLRYFFENKELTAWFFVLCTIKVTDGFAGPITKPLLVDLKLSLSQIGIYITMLGAFSALCGAGLAGLFLKKIKRHQALLLFSVLKLISLAGFVWLAVLYEQAVPVAPWIIYLINALEDMFAAMLLVVILTLVMQYSRSEYAGTDFTFQVSIMASISGVLYTVSGMIGDQLGYLKFLSLILLVGMFCLIPIIYWMRNMYEK